jgi:Rrf2 family protein
MKQAGFVQSRRGAAGGYLLARQPDKITVGEIIQYVEGPLVPVECMIGKAAKECTLRGNCAFIGMWERATKAVSDIYNQISLQDLLDDDERRQTAASLTYSI